MSKAVDHTGVRYGRAVGIRPTEKSKSGHKVWLWRCDCGAEFESVANKFARNKHSSGCRSCSTEARKQRATTHGMARSKEHNAWCNAKQRVFDPNSIHFPVYSKLGMDDDLAESFEAFYQEIGPCPDDGIRYSIDRIDNTIGYRKNNIRWATDVQQARNKGMRSDNISGITGVSIMVDKKGLCHAVAQWTDMEGLRHARGFSFNKYGEELAILAAEEARDQAIRLLNQQGAGYSENYGK